MSLTPNSSDVVAGNDALATEYNDLRKDVLDASEGHVHMYGFGRELISDNFYDHFLVDPNDNTTRWIISADGTGSVSVNKNDHIALLTTGNVTGNNTVLQSRLYVPSYDKADVLAEFKTYFDVNDYTKIGFDLQIIDDGSNNIRVTSTGATQNGEFGFYATYGGGVCTIRCPFC